MNLRLLAGAGLALFGVLAVIACDGSEESTFDKEKQNGEDGGTGSPPLFGTDGGGDAGDGGVRACSPNIPASFQPTWVPPAAPQKVCSAQSIDDYYNACLKGAWNSVACQSFLKSDAACAACLDTPDTAPKVGPVIWRLDHGYFNINIPGCIALVQNNSTDTGCGAAYENFLSCDRAACAACFQKGESTAQFEAYQKCQTQAGGVGVCENLAQTRAQTCGDLTAPDASTLVCLPSTGETIVDVYTRTAKLFCGK